MKITDAHSHIYPDKIAARASECVGAFYAAADMMRHTGSVDELLRSGGAAGVTRYWVYSVATSPAQVRPINSFIARECALHPEFVGFGAIHPDVEDMGGEIQNILDLGLKGVKIHPDFQRFYLDEDRVMGIYEALEGRLPLVTHTGDYRFDFSHPGRLAKVLARFPNLTVVAAHFGGWSVWDEAHEMLHKTNCLVDCSSTFGFLNDD
ncbi:MAG: amidohydrolase family protein, partial [Oscillospiraceae bacterium]|nr:amidohydrolase family protein [Oscillospiraceae bacterium]